MLSGRANLLDALSDREQRRLVRVAQNCNDDTIEQLAAALDNVKMS